jgi:putative hydrolase of the HAD superfamily
MKRDDVAGLVESKRAVIFDLFHTLTAVESSWAESRPTTSELLGVSKEAWHQQLLEKSRERLVGEVKDPFEIIRGMAHAIDPEMPEDLIEKAVRNRIERFAAALTDIPEKNLSVLGQLRDMGKRIGLISNADAMEVAAWNRCPLKPLTDSAIISCEAGYAKPEREIYEICLRELEASPEDCVFVGDGGSNELEGAKRLGIACILVTGIIKEIWPERIAERRRHADFVIVSLDELLRDESGR